MTEDAVRDFAWVLVCNAADHEGSRFVFIWPVSYWTWELVVCRMLSCFFLCVLEV